MHDHADHHDHGDSGWDTASLSPIGEDVEGLEKLTLRSVGIDIGSSTSHLIFSRIVLRREGSGLSARFSVTERTVLHRSRIMLTPYLSGTRIDTQRLATFVHAAYRQARLTAADVDTGAVIITGEALKKENARPIAELFARASGSFICASAGPNHEALLAAHGSGAVALSAARRATVLNVDVGGGTSKLALIRNGLVVQTAAVNVGARLLALDARGRIVRLEEPARRLMAQLGGTVELGDSLDPARAAALAMLMAEVLFEVVQRGPLRPLTRDLLITEPLTALGDPAAVEHVVFSGGVSEFVYARDDRSYGDLGPLLGRAIRHQLERTGRCAALVEPAEGIRATVIGAGEYTLQVSGTTSYVSSRAALPAFGLKVVRFEPDDGPSVEAALCRALARFDLESFEPGLALAITLDRAPDYGRLRRLAEGIHRVVEAAEHAEPLFVVLDLDLAKSLGGILKEELGLARELVAIDGIDVGDLDYVDIGRPIGILEPLPVTVKSLLFPADAGA